MAATLRFHGHACFSIDDGRGATVCIDPFATGGLGGAVVAPTPHGPFDAWVATHDHADHAAPLPGLPRLRPPATLGNIAISAVDADHDEHGGRLRGGRVSLLCLDVAGVRVVHLGDVGERPRPALVAALTVMAVDVLIVPVGGYFTIGADGAAEWRATVSPRVTVPCHAAEDGVVLPQLASREQLLRRIAPAAVHRLPALQLDALPPHGSVVLLDRP